MRDHQIIFEESAALDSVDVRLLDALQRNARSTYAELASHAGLKPPAVYERVKRLEQRGFVRAYAALLDTRRVGLNLCAFVSVYTMPEVDYESFCAALSTLPEVCEIHSVAGE